MKITFLGATKTVTGSNILIETKETKFLLDCGLYQGQQKEIMLNTDQFLYNPADIDFAILWHKLPPITSPRIEAHSELCICKKRGRKQFPR